MSLALRSFLAYYISSCVRVMAFSSLETGQPWLSDAIIVFQALRSVHCITRQDHLRPPKRLYFRPPKMSHHAKSALQSHSGGQPWSAGDDRICLRKHYSTILQAPSGRPQSTAQQPRYTPGNEAGLVLHTLGGSPRGADEMT